MVDLQNKNQRELNNRLSDLKVKMVEVDADIKKLERQEGEYDMTVRRLKKEIQKKKMELDELVLRGKKFKKERFRLDGDRKIFKNKIQEIMAITRNL